MKKLNYVVVLVLMMPFVPLSMVVGLIEVVLHRPSSWAEVVLKPFLWAYERKV